MSKKNIFLILILACFLTIMAISIWGKLPEISSRVAVTGIEIKDSNDSLISEINDSSLNEKVVTLEGKDYEGISVIDYYFSVSVIPSNATNLEVTYSILDEDASSYVSIEEISFTSYMEAINKTITDENMVNEYVNYHFYKLSFTDKKSCTVKFQTNRTDLVKTDYLKVNWHVIEQGGEIDL